MPPEEAERICRYHLDFVEKVTRVETCIDAIKRSLDEFRSEMRGCMAEIKTQILHDQEHSQRDIDRLKEESTATRIATTKDTGKLEHKWYYAAGAVGTAILLGNLAMNILSLLKTTGK